MATPERFPYQQREADLLRVFAAAQREIAAQVMAAIKAGNLQLAGSRRLQLAAVLATLDQLGAHTDPFARQLVADAHTQGAERAARQIAGVAVSPPEIPGAFNSVSRDAVQALQDSITGRLSDSRRIVGRTVGDVYQQAGRNAAVRAILGVEGSPQAASRQLAADLLRDKAIRKMAQQGGVGFIDKTGRRWQLDTYSKMVVRTTTREAVTQGAMDRMISHGVNLARVTTHSSSCPICQPYEGRLVSLDGTITEHMGEPVMDASKIPPFHPSCLIPGTAVNARDAFGAFRSMYSGEVVELATAGGVRLTVTPNHPVMTTAGWLPAGELRQGDHVIRAAPDGTALPRRGDHDFHDVPALIEDVFEALRAGAVRVALAAAGDDFHGDARNFEGEVDVVLADRGLLSELAAAYCEQVSEHNFVWPDVREAALVGSGAPAQVFGGLALTAHGCVSGVSGAGADAHAMLAQPLGHRAHGDVRVDRQVVEPLAGEVARSVGLDVGDLDEARRGHGELLRACPYGHSELLQLGANAHRARAELARQVAERCAVGVHSDELVTVDRKAYSGHVYDPSTPVGSYEANTVIVSNCTHNLTPVVAAVEATRQRMAAAGAV